MSWVTIDRICQEQVDGDEGIRREVVRNGRPLRSSAEPLSDDELLAKLRDFGLDVDRDGVERLCEGALSAQEVAEPIVDKLKLDDDMMVDWVLDQLARSVAEMVAGPALPGTPGRQDAGRLRPGCGERYARGGRDLAGCVV